MMMMTMVLLKTVFVQHIAHESACEAVLEGLTLGKNLRMVNSSLGHASLVAVALRTISKATFLDEPTLDTRVVRKGTCKCLGFWVVLQRTTAKDPVMMDHLREEVSVLSRWQLVIRQIWMLLDGPHLIRVPKAILESVILRDAANDRAEARSHGRHFHSPAITQARTRRGALSGSANNTIVASASSRELPLAGTRALLKTPLIPAAQNLTAVARERLEAPARSLAPLQMRMAKEKRGMGEMLDRKETRRIPK